MLFGYGVESNFDLELERRRDRLGWILLVGMGLCMVASFFLISTLTTEIVQAWFATSLFYGDSFYVRRGKHSSRPWLWKALLATIPIHALYLCAIFWLDRVLPELMTKALVFVPLLALGFAIEAIALQPLIDRFEPN